MDSGSISSAKLGYWSICVIRGIPYDDLAASAGLEPATLALTGRCSGQLELRSHMVSRAGLEPVLDGFWIHFLCQIGILEHMCHKGHTL